MEETEIIVGEGLDPPGDAAHRNSHRLLEIEVNYGQTGKKTNQNSKL